MAQVTRTDVFDVNFMNQRIKVTSAYGLVVVNL